MVNNVTHGAFAPVHCHNSYSLPAPVNAPSVASPIRARIRARTRSSSQPSFYALSNALYLFTRHSSRGASTVLSLTKHEKCSTRAVIGDVGIRAVTCWPNINETNVMTSNGDKGDVATDILNICTTRLILHSSSRLIKANISMFNLLRSHFCIRLSLLRSHSAYRGMANLCAHIFTQNSDDGMGWTNNSSWCGHRGRRM